MLLYLVLYSAAILLLLWFFQLIYLNISYEYFQVKTMNKIASSVEIADENKILESLETIAYENEVCIEYDTAFNSFGFNTRMIGCELGNDNQDISKAKVEIMKSGKTTQAVRLVNKKYKAKAYLYGVQREKGYVYIYGTLEDISNASVILRRQLIYLTIIAIVFACAISYFLSHKITKPIIEIAKKAKKLGSGEHDITFQKNGILEIDELAENLNNAQKELAKTDELRRDLMANVSHDLKTPLTMIKAYAEMIKDISYKNPEKREEHLNIIISETDRLNLLVNDILTLSKMQADADALKKETFDMTEEIKEIIKKYEIIKETENYNFIVEMPEHAYINADKNKMNQVIYNLINNAINYTGKDKMVQIKVIEEKNKYLIEIIDTGKGIKPEELKIIWDKYYKNEKNHKRNIVGTGIGLSIVKNILEKHGFEYGVDSVLKKGTTFYFKCHKAKPKK